MNVGTVARQAVELGRRPEEPAYVIPQPPEKGLASWLFPRRAKRALADPRLEVLRALSSALHKKPASLDHELVAAARSSGWTLADLELFFPSVPWRRTGMPSLLGEAA